MKKVKLKNNNKKKFNFKPFKFLFLIVITISSTILTMKYLVDNSNGITKDEYVNYLLNKVTNKNTGNFIIKEGLKLVSNIDLKNPNTLLDKNMNASEKENTLQKDATSAEDNYDENNYKSITSFIHGDEKNNNDPIIYLYNSHQLETYSNEGLENDNITPNVMMTSYLLKEKLNKNKINTIVEDTNISEFIKISNLKSDSFYASTRIFIKNAMNKYPTLKYFIDIHRDSVDKNVSYAKINNKNYARILFVLGTTNNNYKENEKLMKKLDELADKYYPNLSRGIYNRPTPNWPDAYNQDLNKGVILIEVGGKQNTIEEVSNTTDALCDIIKKYIEENNNEN